MTLGLVCGNRSYDLWGDGVAEDMILLTCCFNTSAPELPALWCLENGKGIFRPGCGRETHVKITISFEPRKMLRVAASEGVRCSMGGSGRLHFHYPSKISPRSWWENVASSCERRAGVVIRVYAQP